MIKWSYSGLKQFTNCPHQYNEVKILRNFETAVSEQMRYGTEVHKALEDYAREGKELAQFYKRFQPMIDSLLEIPGERHLEKQFALKEDRVTPCAFDDPEYWVRGIADFLTINGDTAYLIDYKTGKAKYPDPKQLKLMAIMTFAHFPQVEVVKAGLMFVVHNTFVDEMYQRKEIPKLWAAFNPDLMRLEASTRSNVWPKNPTGLCGWCPVTSCGFHSTHE